MAVILNIYEIKNFAYANTNNSERTITIALYPYGNDTLSSPGTCCNTLGAGIGCLVEGMTISISSECD